MAIDNLNYYSSGLPAGQQTDKYSSQPGCLKSKNLDIFSSSKSVKATAFSAPLSGEGGVIKEEGGLVLKTDGKVYERVDGVDTLFVDPSANFPVYQVSYNGEAGTYVNAQWGTPTDMTVAVEGDEWKSFVVFTDRASYTYSKVKYIPGKTFSQIDGFTYQGLYGQGYHFTKTNTTSSSCTIQLTLDNPPFANIPLRISATDYVSDDTNISLSQVRLYAPVGYYYDGELDAMSPSANLQFIDLSYSGSITDEGGLLLNVPILPVYGGRRLIQLKFTFTKKEGASTYGWQHGELYIDMNGGPDSNFMTINGEISDGDFNYYYSYLPVRDRKLQPVGEYQWMKGTSFQTLYNWESSWVKINGEKKTRYDFVQYMGWANDPGMDIIGMTTWNEQVYMIGNKDGNGYIIPCDLSGGRGTPYIAYGCVFKGVVNIDYLLYLVGEYRGISNLWVFNGQELVSIIGGNKESGDTDLVGVDEQYHFDGKMVDYRKNLILTTSDNRIFQYGQTYGGKGGAFIHELPANAVITDLKAVGNNLEIDYSITVNDTTTNYSIVYQDDIAKKNYNTEWEAVYPVVLGNHLLEKEESDLYVSYILPCASASLEFWGCANHYHFWTFISSDNATLSESESYKIKGASGTYALKFIERNNDQYTFKLEGDLPVNTTSEMKIIDSSNAVVLNYTSFNHFRKIGSISAGEYQEGEFRFHNINNKLDLPKSHSLQIMVKGKGTANYTPELFSLDLVANQRDRG